MRIGLLGYDRQLLDVVEAARRRGDAAVIGCDLPATPPAALAGLRRADSWEALLDPAACDLVLVGRDGWNATRAEAVRTLVQAGRTLLLAQPLELSMLWAYELDMMRRDTGARLVPLLTARLHPFVERLRTIVEHGIAGGGTLGSLESITMVRRLADRNRDAVLARLAVDADLVRVLVGEPARLATLGAADPDTAWSTLAVGFSGPGFVPTRWQVAPGDEPAVSITLQHARGTIQVEAPDDPARPWTWSGPPAESLAGDGPARLLDRLAAPAAGDGVPMAGWADAARAIELAETVPRSLAKGRAIDLHREEFSEIGTFRGTMASLGCGLVLAGLVVLVLATLVGGIAHEFDWELGRRVAAAWPVLVLVVLGAFLALQLLPLVIDADGGRSGGPRPGDGPDRT
jgi:predicted dehydrogenase